MVSTQSTAIIVTSVLPDDFETLAITSKKLYAASQPFIARHNARRSQFTHFEYGKVPQSLFDIEVRTAWDLIRAIAAEPLIPYYIIDANFADDTTFPRSDAHSPFVEFSESSQAIDLIKRSPYHHQAGLDPAWFIEQIASDLDLPERTSLYNRYSQAAAAFVISLLPNVVSLKLPDWWTPGKTDNLDSDERDQAEKLEGFVRAVVASTVRESCKEGAPLSRLTWIGASYDGFGERTHARDLSWHRQWDRKISPFMSLPNIRSLYAKDCMECGGLDELALRNVESVHFEECFLDYMKDMSDLFDNCPKLKVFKYSFANNRIRHQSHQWRIFELIDMIGCKMGSRLEELSISATYKTGVIIFQEVNMKNFQRLQKFEFGLEFVSFLRTERGRERRFEVPDDSGLSPKRSIYETLIPATVVELSILVRGTFPSPSHPNKGLYHVGNLVELFQDFAVNKDRLAPNMNRVLLDCAQDMCDEYRSQCKKTAAELEQAGLEVVIRTPSRYQIYEYDLRWDWPDWEQSWRAFYEAHPRQEFR